MHYGIGCTGSGTLVPDLVPYWIPYTCTRFGTVPDLVICPDCLCRLLLCTCYQNKLHTLIFQSSGRNSDIVCLIWDATFYFVPQHLRTMFLNFKLVNKFRYNYMSYLNFNSNSLASWLSLIASHIILNMNNVQINDLLYVHQ